MSDWQERITHETAPAIRVEHDLRYLSAAPLILSGGPWADLGCGNGLAAASALGTQRPHDIVLVDLEESAALTAASELDVPAAERIAGDLTDPALLGRIGELLIEAPGDPVVTCFEVVEHLSAFLPLLEWSLALTREHRATFILSVPNDAFWATQNPHHVGSWGIGAFDELTQLLPAERTVLRQIALNGSAILDWGAGAQTVDMEAELDGQNAVASHFLVAFGPRHTDLRRGARAMQADAEQDRRLERERESYRVGLREALAEQDRTIARQQEELQAQTAEFEKWRIYIHELEAELGRSPSGGQGGTEADPAS